MDLKTEILIEMWKFAKQYNKHTKKDTQFPQLLHHLSGDTHAHWETAFLQGCVHVKKK